MNLPPPRLMWLPDRPSISWKRWSCVQRLQPLRVFNVGKRNWPNFADMPPECLDFLGNADFGRNRLTIINFPPGIPGGNEHSQNFQANKKNQTLQMITLLPLVECPAAEKNPNNRELADLATRR